MEYTNLGKTGLKVSRVGLGAWQFSESWGLVEYEKAKSIVHRALELGINFFDTAMVYGRGLSENILGKALNEIGVRRDQVIVSTKIPGDFLNPQDIYKSVNKSIEILGLKYIDVLLAHWPPCWHNFPTYVYARALEKLVKMGLVNYLGLSNYPVELVESFRNSLASTDVEVFQIRYNLVERSAEEELIPYAEACNITVQAWSPIAKGALTGKYTPENIPKFEDVRVSEPVFDPDNFSRIWPVILKLREIGEKYGKKPVQVALNWLIMASPVIIPIPGAKDTTQVEDFADSVDWRMSYQDWIELEELSSNVNILQSISYLKYRKF